MSHIIFFLNDEIPTTSTCNLPQRSMKSQWLAELLSFLLLNFIYILVFKFHRSATRRRAVAEIPVKIYSDEMTGNGDRWCPICFEEYEDGDKVRVLVNCMHFFHVGCLDSWLLKANALLCPICRRHAIKG